MILSQKNCHELPGDFSRWTNTGYVHDRIGLSGCIPFSCVAKTEFFVVKAVSMTSVRERLKLLKNCTDEYVEIPRDEFLAALDAWLELREELKVVQRIYGRKWRDDWGEGGLTIEDSECRI